MDDRAYAGALDAGASLPTRARRVSRAVAKSVKVMTILNIKGERVG